MRVKREEAEIRCHGVQLKCFTYLPFDVKEHAGSCALGARVYFAKAVFEVGSVGKCAVGDSLFLITVRNCRCHAGDSLYSRGLWVSGMWRNAGVYGDEAANILSVLAVWWS